MLDPYVRNDFFRMLRPPEGYTISGILGTTFSLDLYTLLVTPMAFTWFEIEDDKGNIRPDPLRLLNSVREYAEKICLFCQAGQISLPKSNNPLYGYLEKSIVEVSPRHGKGVFHPKVWVLRYTTLKSEIFYRLLILSRNLTFDRSWDTALVIQGELSDRRNSFSTNYPLRDFINTLTDLAIHPVPPRIIQIINMIHDEIGRVKFVLPKDLELVAFHPLGIAKKYSDPITGRIDRMCIISPFLSDSFIEEKSKKGKNNIIISSQEVLEKTSPESLAGFSKVFFMNQAILPEDEDSIEDEDEEINELNGLHAKLYIADEGWNTRLWTGSANATDAAFLQNVEFLVELRGKKSQYGIDALLGNNGKEGNLRSLLQEFIHLDVLKETDSIQQELQEKIRDGKYKLAKAGLAIEVKKCVEENIYDLLLNLPNANSFSLPLGVKCKSWPITINEASAQFIAGDSSPFEFHKLPIDAITSFFAFEITACLNEKKLKSRFVLNLPLNNEPSGRQERILLTALNSKDTVLRFLLMLLNNDSFESFISQSSVANDSGKGYGWSTFLNMALCEEMLKALAREPQKIDSVKKLVDDLNKTPEGQALLPVDFMKLWNPVWKVRERMGQ